MLHSINDAEDDEDGWSGEDVDDCTTSKKETPAREKSKPAPSLGDCLMNGMGTMASAMIEVAKINAANSSSNNHSSLAPFLESIDKRLCEQSEINKAMLLALQNLHK